MTAATEIAAADDDGRAGLRLVGEEASHRPGAVGERRDLEDAERAVPEHRPGRLECLLHQRLTLLAEIDDVPRRGDLVGGQRLVLGALGDLLGHDDVDRQDDPDALALGHRQDPLGVLHPVVLRQALAHRLALGDEEGVGHPAADDDDVDLVHQVGQDLDLARHLGPADDRRERSLGILEESRQGLDLGLHQQAGVGRQELGDADRRGMRPVGGPEGVVDVQVGVGGQGLGEGGVVLLLLDVEAEVLEQEGLARPEPLDGVLGAQAQGVARCTGR